MTVRGCGARLVKEIKDDQICLHKQQMKECSCLSPFF